MYYYCYGALTHTPLVLPGAVPRDVSPPGHQQSRLRSFREPYNATKVLLGAASCELGRPVRHPMRPLSFRALRIRGGGRRKKSR